MNRYYFIKKFDQSHIDKQDKKTIMIFRNYDKKIDEKLILTIKNYCKKKGNKFLISNNIKLAIKLNLDGAYIPSFNHDKKHLSYSVKKNFIFYCGIKTTKAFKKLAILSVNAATLFCANGIQ